VADYRKIRRGEIIDYRLLIIDYWVEIALRCRFNWGEWVKWVRKKRSKTFENIQKHSNFE